MICRTDISNLKTDILEKVGQKIIVKGSLGRSRTFEKEATIEKAYPNIFVVRYEENNRNVTYSYTDSWGRTGTFERKVTVRPQLYKNKIQVYSEENESLSSRSSTVTTQSGHFSANLAFVPSALS